MPQTRSELSHFTWLSLSAGVCEELLYRGLLLTALTTVAGLWPAVVLSSLAFGLGHAYQGVAGVLRTGVVGLIMACIVVFTGSLPLAIAIHVVLDVTQGRLLWAAFNSQPDRPSAPSDALLSNSQL